MLLTGFAAIFRAPPPSPFSLPPYPSPSLSLSQVTNPVQFEQSLTNVMGKGFEHGYECGPGKVVAGILKRVDKKAQMTNIQV